MNPAYDLQILSDYLLQQRRAQDRRERMLREALEARRTHAVVDTREPLSARITRALRFSFLVRRADA